LKNLLRPGGALSLLVAGLLCAILMAKGVTREVPLGSVDGTVIMAENGRPLGGADVVFRPAFKSDFEVRTRSFKVRSDGRFAIRNLPAGTYTVEAYSRAHAMDAATVTIKEGAPTTVELSLEPGNPYLELSASQHVFTKQEKPSFVLSGFIPDEKAQISVYRVGTQQVADSGGLSSALDPLGNYRGQAEVNEKLKTLGPPIKTLDHVISSRDGEGVFNDYVTLDPFPNGIYWVEFRTNTLRRGTYLNVTQLSLITKSVKDDVLCFASDIVSGKPVSGVAISSTIGGQLTEQGQTGSDGTLRFKQTLPEEGGQTLVSAAWGGSTAFVNFYVPRAGSNGAYTIFTYTDRPIYRPGHEVHFKGIIRARQGTEYNLPAGGAAEIEVREPDDTLIYKTTLPVSQNGTYSGKFSFDNEAALGNYSLVTTYQGATQRHSVEVAAYRKPEFTIKVKPEKPFYVRGDRARVTATCEYYFGGPVVGAKVTGYIYRSPAWNFESEDESFEGEYSDGSGEYVEEIEGVTDGRGQATFEFDTLREGDPKKLENDYVYTISVSAEEGDKYFDGSGTVKVTRGEFGLGIDTDRYIAAPGEPIEATISAKWHDGGRPVVSRRMRVDAGTEEWNGNESTFKPYFTRTVSTDAQGRARLTIDQAKAGSLTIRVSAEDDRGNEIEASAWAYIEGGVMPAGPMPKLSVKLDRKKFSVGDVAKVMIETDQVGSSAILAVEGDEIYSSKVISLDQSVTVLEVPVTAAMAPNAFISVATVKNKRYSEASAGVPIDLVKKRLHVALTSDQPTYSPGQTVTYTITTQDEQGHGVPAEVSVGVVDESIYAVREDSTDIVSSFYPMRSNAVQTYYSFPELYLDGGDKSPADLQVRSKFLDTAAWIPTVMTDASGSATVRVTLPDNLTSWRATAIAASADTRVGQTTLNVRARKDLMVRLQAPGYLVQGDVQSLSGTLINDSGRSATVHVDLATENAAFTGSRNQTIVVEPGKPAKLEWKIRATGSGQAAFTAKAWIDGGDSDGERKVVPVKPHGRLWTDQFSGEVTDSETLRLALRPNADLESGRLKITLSPSIAATLVQSLDGLIDYPYGCVEQTMSRLMPAVLVSQTLKGIGLPPVPRAKEIPKIVREGYLRLKNMQSWNGGWGWWENDSGDPYMTAYVLEGISLAGAAGYPYSTIDTDRALDWAVGALKTKEAAKWKQSDRIYLEYVLALYGRTDAAAAFIGAEKLDDATGAALAMATMTFAKLGDAHRAEDCLARLMRKANVTPATIGWEEEGWYGYETTGRAMLALMTVRGASDPDAAKVARYLMQARKADMWMSTRDTAVVLTAMSRFLAATKEGGQDSEVSIVFNGSEMRRIRMPKGQIYNPDLTIELPLKQLRQGDNVLELRRVAGRAYYSVDMRQTIVQPKLGEVLTGSSLTIQRSYFLLEPRKLEDGSMRLLASQRPVDEVPSGKPVRVILTIHSKQEHEFIMVEDPAPSNCRIMEGGLEEYANETYSKLSAYDDRAVFFLRRLPKGITQLEYTIRSESPGTSSALPPVLSNMYDPKVKATTAENRMQVYRP
jgi:uncharacterized protein YfaS (alpha-2-macroglobulin family)